MTARCVDQGEEINQVRTILFASLQIPVQEVGVLAMNPKQFNDLDKKKQDVFYTLSKQRCTKSKDTGNTVTFCSFHL